MLLWETGHFKAEVGQFLSEAGAHRACCPKCAFWDIEFMLVFQEQKILKKKYIRIYLGPPNCLKKFWVEDLVREGM